MYIICLFICFRFKINLDGVNDNELFNNSSCLKNFTDTCTDVQFEEELEMLTKSIDLKKLESRPKPNPRGRRILLYNL